MERQKKEDVILEHLADKLEEEEKEASSDALHDLRKADIARDVVKKENKTGEDPEKD